MYFILFNVQLIFAYSCVGRNSLISNSYNIQNQPNILPLGLLFNGSALDFSIINNNNTQNAIIYQSLEPLGEYINVIETNSIIAMSQYPLIVNSEMIIQILILTKTEDIYYIYSTKWQVNTLDQHYSLILSLNQYLNCSKISRMNDVIVALFCDDQILLYNLTSLQQITTQSILQINFTKNFTWFKSIGQDTIYIAFSDVNENFQAFGYTYVENNLSLIKTITQVGCVSGFEIFEEQQYFMIVNNSLIYVEGNVTYQIDIEIDQVSYLAVFQGINKLGQLHYYVGVLNQDSIIQFIYNNNQHSISSQFIQNYMKIPINTQPQIQIDQYYITMQLQTKFYAFVGYENKNINISPLIYYPLQNSSQTIYLLYNDQLIIQTPSNATLNQINSPILVFEKPTNQTSTTDYFTYTILAESQITNLQCYQNYTQKSVSSSFNQIQQYQDCSLINIQLYNPEIQTVNIDYCALGPNITYQAGTYVALEELGIDEEYGQFIINVNEIDILFQELAIYQINSIYTFQSPKQFTYFTYLMNPLNGNQYVQLIQFGDNLIEFQICDKWVCQNTTLLQLNYELTMTQIGPDISQKSDYALLITNSNNDYELCIYELSYDSIIQQSVLNVASSFNLTDEIVIQQILLSGPYLFVIIDNPNELLAFNIYNFEPIIINNDNLQPRKLEQNYHSYGDNIFLDNTVNLIIFEMIDQQFTICATIPYPNNSTSAALGLLSDGVYIALDYNGQSQLYYYSRQLLFQSIINQMLVIEIPIYNGQFIQPMQSSFSEQYFYIQMLMPDNSIQLSIFKTDYNLLYLSYYFKEQFNSMSVIQVETLQNFDLIGFQSSTQFSILQNYWEVSIILNSEFLVPGIQLLSNTQILAMCTNNYLDEYMFSFPVSVNNSYYQIVRTNLSYPPVSQTNYIFTLTVNPLKYFTGSLIYYNILSRGKNNAFIKQNIIDDYFSHNEQINSATYQSPNIYAINNQYAFQFEIFSNITTILYEFQSNQYTTCNFIFVYQQQPIAFCTNVTDTYVYINGQTIYSVYSLTGNAQPNLIKGYYYNQILILGFNQSPYDDCVNIMTYYLQFEQYLTLTLLEQTENCVYELTTFTMLDIYTNTNNNQTYQCIGWIGITDDISTFPFHYNCYNFSQLITSITYSPKQLFIQSILSNSIKLIQISQIGNPKVYNNYSELTLLFQSENNAYAFTVDVYENSVKLGNDLLVFQQFSNQKAIQTVSNYDIVGNLNVITLYLQQVGSQIFQTLCIYQPLQFSQKLKVVEFLYCKTLHSVMPSTLKYTPFLFYVTDNLLLTNHEMLIIQQELLISVNATADTESYLYLYASNFDSSQNLTISIIQIDLNRTYTGWIIFSFLLVTTIAIIWAYQYIRKLRNANPDTENYIEL